MYVHVMANATWVTALPLLCFASNYFYIMLQGRTALIHAAAVGNAVMVEQLLMAGADVCLSSAKARILEISAALHVLCGCERPTFHSALTFSSFCATFV